ncbi:peptidoglycan DD-metalloendopeptidase family protein [Hoeflea sp. YIM 152468]|uniref:peptidoglycan DD-metalloendopeptidase family protein n=1 Tax=Hoeflea sp. YIM 152468 TaxID=3031759 RepID=UPI0023DCAC85|nr:peptidoglycan DD-metalloendopeptidase family protein [Hoeflea sp. YIM 152468]MDF1609893.1 peptidoglycan DD-metalloendopeptidase family protein [Hoeflea sp. YIM 152468]
MRLRQTVVPGASVTRLLGVALLAGSAAACSSDSSRFAYRDTDQLLTASVPQPSSTTLAPMASVGGASGAQGAYPQANSYPQTGQSSFPQAPSAVSQAFPGDYRSPVQPGYDPTSTGSIPGSAARSAASSDLITGGVQRSSVVTRQLAPAEPSVPTPAKLASSATQETFAAPQAQAFPDRPQQLSSSVPVSPRYEGSKDTILAPDPIVTGTASQDAGWTTTGGTRIALGEGETIYNLSKRYGVPASEIMKANGITDASRVNAGRQLLIPVYVYSRQAPVSAPDSNPNTRAANAGTGLRGEARQTDLPVPAPAPDRDVAVLPNPPSLRNPGSDAATTVTESAARSDSNANADGVYVVKGGDTLSRIAQTHGVSVDALKSANQLSGATIRIGQTLSIPAPKASRIDKTTTTASVQPSDRPKSYTPPVSAAGDSVGAKTKGDMAAIAPAATGIDKFRWPARGQVITGFAKSENGKRNDGIDISMPTGTPIKAAENGVVIYSGDGLKEYGKTVLIRHDDGLVTVYAHADKLNVNRGDKVVRGQVIANSGMTGGARTPRLHFEVRKNASPVDPVQYLE